MSWSVSLQKIPAAQVGQTISEATIPHDLPPETADEAQLQLAVAKVAAQLLFYNGVVGDEGEYNILLNGHAEPNHIRRPGYASDAVTVTVQRYYDYSADGR